MENSSKKLVSGRFTMKKFDAYTPDYTPDSLRERIIGPLRDILRELEKDLELFEKTAKDGGIPRGTMPLSGKLAERAVTDLANFQSGQLRKKLFALLRGADIYRDSTKKKLKEKYRAEKKQNNGKK